MIPVPDSNPQVSGVSVASASLAFDASCWVADVHLTRIANSPSWPSVSPDPGRPARPAVGCGTVVRSWKGAPPSEICLNQLVFGRTYDGTDPTGLAHAWDFDGSDVVPEAPGPPPPEWDGTAFVLSCDGPGPYPALVHDGTTFGYARVPGAAYVEDLPSLLAKLQEQGKRPVADWFRVAPPGKECHAVDVPPPARAPRRPSDPGSCSCFHPSVPHSVAWQLATFVVSVHVPTPGPSRQEVARVGEWIKGSGPGEVVLVDEGFGTDCALPAIHGDREVILYLAPPQTDGFHVSRCTYAHVGGEPWSPLDPTLYPEAALGWVPPSGTNYSWQADWLHTCDRGSGILATPEAYRPLPLR